MHHEGGEWRYREQEEREILIIHESTGRMRTRAKTMRGGGQGTQRAGQW